MKICENCGMEYGDDNCFCPYCDERYGIVITENDVISADFPAYSEEFPPIGETCVTEESFIKNRDKIYERNTHLANDDKYLYANDVNLLYEPINPVFKTGKNGKIIPYAPVTPTVKKSQSNLKSKLTFGNISCVLAVLAIFVFIVKSWHDGLNNVPDPYINSPFPEVSEAAYEDEQLSAINKRPKYKLISNSSAEKITRIYGSDGKSFMYIMHKPDNGYWDYQFSYYNKGNAGADFPELFAEYDEFKDFTEMLIEYPQSEAMGILLINDGVPDLSTESLYLPNPKEDIENKPTYRKVEYDDIVLGHFTSQTPIAPDSFEFNDINLWVFNAFIPTNITVKSESGLNLKLTYSGESTKENVYKYDFKFTNTTNNDIDSFWNEFIGADYTDKFFSFTVSYPGRDSAQITWDNGIPTVSHYYYYTYENGEKIYLTPAISSGNTVNGYVELDFSGD